MVKIRQDGVELGIFHRDPSTAMAGTSRQPQIYVSFAVTIDSFLGSMPAPRKFEQAHNLPCFREDVNGPLEEGFEQDIPTVRDLRRSVAPPTSESGNALNARSLLQRQALDTEAVCTVLGLVELPDKAITALHYWRTVRKLREILRRRTAPRRIPHGEAFARILVRLAERFTRLLDPPEPAHVPLLPLGHVEGLDSLVEDMEKGFCFMRQTGVEEDVYIFRENEDPLGCSERLKCLASHLRGASLPHSPHPFHSCG